MFTDPSFVFMIIINMIGLSPSLVVIHFMRIFFHVQQMHYIFVVLPTFVTDQQDDHIGMWHVIAQESCIIGGRFSFFSSTTDSNKITDDF